MSINRLSLIALIQCLALFTAQAENDHNSNLFTPTVSPEQPNILWLCIEDTNSWMSCYGDKLIKTPNIDQLASEGIRFNRAYMTAAVCSASRSALITGMYQTTIGAHQHYSSFSMFRGKKMTVWDPNHLGVKTLPEMFRAAGYYTFNEGKDHYNFVYDRDTFYNRHSEVMDFKGARDGTEWSGRKPGQPFFGQIQLIGGKFSNPTPVVKPEDVSVQPYYPDHPIIREDIARHYNTILELDKALGVIIDALKRDGLYENTVIFFFADHGCDLPRHKQFLYDEGLRVPFILTGPKIPVGKVRDDLVSSIDISATSLALANITVPAHMHGKDMLAEGFHRDFTIGARDRCDFTIDRIRAVTTQRYRYIRNFLTDRPYLQANYRSDWPIMRTLQELYAKGQLNEAQARFVSPERPAEEFYDLYNDPFETKNLVHSVEPEVATALAQHRDILYRWIIETDDKGRFPESDEGLQACLERWGDAAVAPEFDRIRKKLKEAKNPPTQ